ncbi:GGDEF domain-containing protein [Thermodesulfovibrio hydrogeniphilus]
MSAKSIILNLSKDIHKWFLLNIIAILAISSLMLSTLGYSKNDIILIVSGLTVGAIIFNFLFAKIMKKRTEETINNLFAKVESQLYYDELTSVYNRKAGFDRLMEEMARMRRNGGNLSIAMIDIDNFKSINDKYGHLVGDRVLRHIAMEIKKSLRLNDIVSRYGGEEFLVILPDTDEISACFALERVRESISKKPVNIGREKLYITVSIGIAELSFNENPIDAIERADNALYRAKYSGKNRIEVGFKHTVGLSLS